MSASQPLVSVIMATYNRADFLREAIDSVLSQDYEHFELIIVDDGSTDNTQSLIASNYAAEPRLSYFYQQNAGQMAAINAGLERASGDFVALIDSDNAWVEGKLKHQLTIFEQHPEVDIVYGDIIIIDENSIEQHRHNMQRYSGRIAAQLLKDNCVSVNTAMTRMKCFKELGGMSTEVEVAGDYEMWLRFSSRYVFHYEPTFWARYRVMKDQISSDKTRRFRNTEKIVRNFVKQYPEATTFGEKRRGLAHFFIRKCRYYLEVGKYSAAYVNAFKALSFHPFFVPTYRALLKTVLNSVGVGR